MERLREFKVSMDRAHDAIAYSRWTTLVLAVGFVVLVIWALYL